MLKWHAALGTKEKIYGPSMPDRSDHILSIEYILCACRFTLSVDEVNTTDGAISVCTSLTEPHVPKDTINFLAPVNHVSDVKVNDGGSNTVTVMHSRGESGVTKTRTVRIDSNGVAADITVIKKGDI